jgi:hypothetical protein
MVTVAKNEKNLYSFKFTELEIQNQQITQTVLGMMLKTNINFIS